MNSEYVKLNRSERVYGVKNLLKSQVSILTLLKHAKEFEHLRKKELSLRVDLRGKIDEMLHLIGSLNGTLPKIQIKKSYEEDDLFSGFEREHEFRKRTIDQELDEIRRKIESLE